MKPRQPAGVGGLMERGRIWRGPSAAAAGCEPLRWRKQWERRRRLDVAFVISLWAPFLSWFGSAAPLGHLFRKKKPETPEGCKRVRGVLGRLAVCLSVCVPVLNSSGGYFSQTLLNVFQDTFYLFIYFFLVKINE